MNRLEKLNSLMNGQPDRLARLNNLMSGQTAVADPDEVPITPDVLPQPSSGRLQRLQALQQGLVQPEAPKTSALTDTGTPERPDNITAQYNDMLDPNTGRDAVFIGAATKNPYNGLPLDKNVFRVDSAAGTLYTTNKVKADKYRQTPTDDVRTEILGYNQPKSSLIASGANNAQIVVVTDPNSGKRLFEEATTEPDKVIEKYQKQGYKNITIETPAQMQVNRTLPADPQDAAVNLPPEPLPVTQTPTVQPGLTTFERLVRDIKTIGQATKVIAKQPYKEGEIYDIIKNITTRAFSPLAYLMPGVSHKELIAELDKEAEQFTGFGSAIAPAAGETGSMALELSAFQKLFGLASKGAEVLGKIPAIEKVAEAANKIGGVRQFAEKFPRIFQATKTALKDFAIGDVIGQGYGALKGADEDKSGIELFKEMQKEGLAAGAWSGAFSIAGSADRALYVKRLREAMVKRFDLDLQQKVSQTQNAQQVKTLSTYKDAGLQYIDNVVASIESDLTNFAKGELYPNIRDKVVNISPEKAAVRFLKYGYETGKIAPQAPEKLKTGMGTRETIAVEKNNLYKGMTEEQLRSEAESIRQNGIQRESKILKETSPDAPNYDNIVKQAQSNLKEFTDNPEKWVNDWTERNKPKTVTIGKDSIVENAPITQKVMTEAVEQKSVPVSKQFTGWNTPVTKGGERIAGIQSVGLPTGQFIALDKPFESTVHNPKNAKQLTVEVKNTYDPDGLLGNPSPSLSEELTQKANIEKPSNFRKFYTEFLKSKGYDSYVRGIDGDPKNKELIVFPKNQPSTIAQVATKQSNLIQSTPESTEAKATTQEQVVNKLQIKRAEILPRKDEILSQLDEALKNAPAKKDYKEDVHGKLHFEIDGGVNVYNNKEALQFVRDRVKALPKTESIHNASTGLFPSAKVGTNPKKESIEILLPSKVKGVFGNKNILITGTPPTTAKIQTHYINSLGDKVESHVITQGDVDSIFNTKTEPAELQGYSYVHPEYGELYSKRPIAISQKDSLGKIDKDKYPVAVFKDNNDNVFAYGQYNLNSITKRFPNADYGVNESGILIAYENKKPVAALAPEVKNPPEWTLNKLKELSAESNDEAQSPEKKTTLHSSKPLVRSGFDVLTPTVAQEAIHNVKSTVTGMTNIVKSSGKTIGFYTGRAAAFIEKNYGEPGKQLARDVREIVFQVNRRVARQWGEVKKVLNKLNRQERIALMKTGQGRFTPMTSSKIRAANDAMLTIMDMDMNDAAAAGYKRLIGGQWKDLKGSGKWSPQVLNSFGKDIMQRWRESGDADPKVAAMFDRIVESGEAENLEAAKQIFLDWNNSATRKTHGYFERPRVILPQEMVEFDPEKVLFKTIEHNALMIEAAKVWGGIEDAPSEISDETGNAIKSVDFVKAKQFISQIGGKYGQTHAQALKKWIRTEFGLSNDVPDFVSDLVNTVNRYQTFVRLGYRIPSAIRNLTQGNVNLFTAPLSAHIRTIKNLNVLNWSKNAAALRQQIERSGAVIGQKELAEVEQGATAEVNPPKLSMKLFSAAEESNHYRAALIARYAAEQHIKELAALRKGGVLRKILSAIKQVSIDPEGYLENLVKNKTFTNPLNDEELTKILEHPLTLDDIDRIMSKAAIDTQFTQNMATRPIPWRTNPFLRLGLKFKTFSINQTRLLWEDAVKSALKGTLSPLLKYLVFSALAGEIWNLLNDAIRGGDNSLTSTMINRPEKRNISDISFLLLNDFVDGGGVGIMTDIAYGVGNFLIGSIGQSAKNYIKFATNLNHPLTAARQLLRDEMAVWKDVEGLTSRIDKTFIDENNKYFEYKRWRDRAYEWRDETGKDTGGKTGIVTKLEAGAKKILLGQTQYDSDLMYKYAANQITLHDIDDAADYLAERIRDSGKNRKETLKGIKLSMKSHSPLGKIPLKDRAAFLATFTPQEQEQAIKLQRQWLGDYEQAIYKAFIQYDQTKR